uniref:Zinc finger PHD-type domain-containing protein n=1 Tax=Ditylenchus dipsaci TaxID=166011 RepID=A0A915DW71_9BILA
MINFIFYRPNKETENIYTSQTDQLKAKPNNNKLDSKGKISAVKSLVNTTAVKRKDSKALIQKSASLDSNLPKLASLSLPSATTSCSVESSQTVFALPKVVRTKSDSKWISTSPIFVADSRTSGPYDFPIRKRHLICFVCGETDDNLKKCSSPNCSTKFHEMCARLYTGGGYALDFMSRNKGIFCSRHHCTGCFADHNRTRAFNGPLINCSQCELSWHNKCIPGGCVLDKKSEIICPRHIAFQNPPHLHITHCADCQQKADTDEALVKCNNCLRSLHFKCFKEGAQLELEGDTQELRDSAICNWCKGFDFVRYGQYCMARLGSKQVFIKLIFKTNS